MIIYLPAPVFLPSSEQLGGSSEKLGLDGPPFSFRPRATIPEDHSRKIRAVRAGYPPSVLSCTTWGFSCLANYSASGELLPRLFTLACAFLKEPAVSFSVTLSVTAIPITFGAAAPARFTRHAAVWCSDFPPANLSIHQRSSAIGD